MFSEINLFLLALVALSVALIPRCGFAGTQPTSGLYIVGCVCQFPNGTRQCISRGPFGDDLYYQESSDTGYGGYYRDFELSLKPMCTVSSTNPGSPVSGNSTICPVAIGLCDLSDKVQCCYSSGCDACVNFLTCSAATTATTTASPGSSQAESSTTSSSMTTTGSSSNVAMTTETGGTSASVTVSHANMSAMSAGLVALSLLTQLLN